MLRSIVKPVDLINKAIELDMPSVAITDSFSFGGIWEAYKHSQRKKIKLIVGCQYSFVDDVNPIKEFLDGGIKNKPKIEQKNVVLIAKNKIGYQNLLKLNIDSFDYRLNKTPTIDWNMLEKYNEGVICLTGNYKGILAYDMVYRDYGKVYKNAERLKNIFEENLFAELQPNNLQFKLFDQTLTNYKTLEVARKLNITPIAASNSRYLNKEQHKILDMLMSISSGRSLRNKSRPKFDYPQLYLHTREDVVSFFKRNYVESVANELCDNTLIVSDMCEKPNWVKTDVLTKDKVQLPTFDVKSEDSYNDFKKWKDSREDLKDLDEDKKYMRFWCEKNWDKLVPKNKEKEYKERYYKELDVYEKLGFSSYMLITADFLRWTRNNNIPIGYGRGSVGGSLVGYLLDIHNADPIKYGLIFERFLNEHKKEYPDIDNDVSGIGREKVLQYVEEKYGKTYVAHVSNFITFTPKVVITDVMTSLEIGGSRADAFKIAKNITETIPNEARNIDDAIKESKLFAEFVKERPEIKEYCEQLVGNIRSFATHAAGVVIGKNNLKGLVPLRLDDNGTLALEWEKTKTEENGLVKIDFLGLETLNIVKNTKDIIKSLGKEVPKNIDFDTYYNDTYDLISDGNTFGVFQFGTSGGTINLCKLIEPKSLEDLAVITSLARPGVPPDVKKSYIERRFGREEVVIPHANLNRAIKDTMGYCIFEEAFLWLAHDFCGWDLQKADKMRKISKLKKKGKKILEELYNDFIKDSMEHSKISKEFAEKIWNEWIIPLSGYAFNKSHAILYSMTSLNTAYLKANYFNEFMTANLISETQSNAPKAKENILKIKHALRKNGVNIIPPDINKSFENYRLIDEKTLITGFSALHGVKEPAAKDIIEKRPFSSFEDFLYRTDSSKVRAPTIQALSACGALDCFDHTRKSMCLYVSDLRKKYMSWVKRNPDKKFEYELPKEEWDVENIRALESHFLGESLTGTKKDSFKNLFSGNNSVSNISDLENFPNRTNVILEGEVKDLFFFKVKKETSKIFGQECCRMLLEDLYDDQVGIVLFPEALSILKMLFEHQLSTNKIEKGFGIRISGSISRYNNEISIIGSDIYGLFLPLEISTKIEQKKLIISKVSSKKIKEIKSEDVEDDILSIIE
jgi:DNA polymerase-3 subunit alpha